MCPEARRVTVTSAMPASSLRRLFEHAVHEARPQGLVGALLVSRHGSPIAVAAELDDVEGFCAMHATALGAAEVAFARLGVHTEVSLVAETDGRRFVSRGVNSTMFAVAVVDDSADCRSVLDWMASLEARFR